MSVKNESAVDSHTAVTHIDAKPRLNITELIADTIDIQIIAGNIICSRTWDSTCSCRCYSEMLFP